MEKSQLGQSQDTILKPSLDKDGFPVRYIITALFFVGCCIMYPLRVGLNIAIVAMVNSSVYSSGPNNTLDLGCPIDDDGNYTTTVEKKEGHFIWTVSEQGIILGAFYYGYTVTNLLGGRLSDRFGSKLTFGGGIGCGAVLTLLIPVLAEWHAAPLIIVRILIGAFQGLSFPAIFTVFPVWFPPNEISAHLAMALSGNQVGIIIGMYLGGYLSEHGFAGGWPSVFYVFGIMGCVFTVVFWFLMYNTPEEHPRISAKELQLITGHRKMGTNDANLPVPWKKIATSVPVWSLITTQVLAIYAMHVLLTRIQAYLDGVLHFSVEKNGQINAIMFLGKGIVSISIGFLSNYILKKNIIRKNALRKIFESVALIGIGTSLMVIPFIGCDATVVSVILVLSMTISGFDCGGVVPAITEIAPCFSGTIFGIGNTFVAITGFVAPMVVGAILEDNPNSVDQWSYVFYSSAAVCYLGFIVFALFASSDLQPWAKVDPNGDKTETELEENERY